MQGTSFVPVLKDPDIDWKQAAFSQFHRRPKVSADGHRYMGYSINTDAYHYIEWFAWDHKLGKRGAFKSAELYDSMNDPNETINVAQETAFLEIRKTLSQQLTGGWRKALPN